MSTRQTLITFRGSLPEFREFLARLTDLFNDSTNPAIYDSWELEASIARHHAGKARAEHGQPNYGGGDPR